MAYLWSLYDDPFIWVGAHGCLLFLVAAADVTETGTMTETGGEHAATAEAAVGAEAGIAGTGDDMTAVFLWLLFAGL
jgi:hypothetical protein